MASRDSSIRALAKQLGKEYRVVTIDFEPVVYRDFGNGFNVEISRMYTTSKKRKANIYLWHGDSNPDCLIVYTARDVCREDISDVVEELFRYSERLIREGFNNRHDILFSVLPRPMF